MYAFIQSQAAAHGFYEVLRYAQTKAGSRAISLGREKGQHDLFANFPPRDYPNIPIHVRPYDGTHAYELMDKGVQHFERETCGSALLIGCKVLEIMGVHPYQAWRTAQQFRIYDTDTLHCLYPYRRDEKQFISKTR